MKPFFHHSSFILHPSPNMAGLSANRQASSARARPAFPFAAVVGQEEMKLALLLNVIAPAVGGVLVTGHRGTAKSTAVRALADLLPKISAARGCAYNCDPTDPDALCDDCLARLRAGEKLKAKRVGVPVVELPLGATEDRVCGTIDLGRALKEGVKAFEPGLLARANRGFLYIDEVNLLEDHLVDLLLDVAATARNRVEREGVSAEHPSRFRLVGSCNPEEGELRPQLLDRFGLCAEVETLKDLDSRVLIVERREAFESDPAAFVAAHAEEQERLRRRVTRAARAYASVKVPREVLRSIAELCLRLNVDGHRGEITIARAARALAAFEGRREVTSADVRRVAPMSLRHRLRRDPLEQAGGARVENHLDELFGDANEAHSGGAAKADGRRDDSVQQRSHAKPLRAENGRGSDDDARLNVAPVDVKLNEESQAAKTADTSRRARSDSHTARVRTGTRGSTFTARGRYAGASVRPERETRRVAVDATLRVAAPRLSRAGDDARTLDEGELRFKRFKGKAGTLFVFLVDVSGSMALNRIGQAKGALAQLLRRSYVNRDRVSLISFRGRDAEVLLAPSASVSRARRLLDEMSVGGGSPLAAGLARSLEVARRAKDAGARQIRLVVFTDGRANVPLVDERLPSSNASSLNSSAARKARIADEILRLGASLREACAGSLVIDTQARFTSGGEGEFLSDALGARYLRLPQLITESSLAEAL
ncbi:MAG TPA: magnesium chelatase ATPase subunit I [Pyrinomonadaceae bacterium]|nr:magnesium chelatase ATPase subunit I [Pyrinomonadaceae bacterium]